MHMKREHLSIFVAGSIISFAVALLIATGVISSTHEDAWLVGGLLSLSLAVAGR